MLHGLHEASVAGGSPALFQLLIRLQAGSLCSSSLASVDDMDHRFLSAAVETGQAVDDSRVDNPARPQMIVDSIPWEQHAALLEEISAVVASQAR